VVSLGESIRMEIEQKLEDEYDIEDVKEVKTVNHLQKCKCFLWKLTDSNSNVFVCML
jgi:hypothetical protein